MADAQKTREIPVFSPDMANPYMPYIATLKEVVRETHNIMTFRVVFDDAEAMKNFHYEPGQVGQLSLFGAGESTFVINSPPTRKEYLQFSVMRAGEVTAALHQLKAGDKVGVRGPLGNHFPYNDMKGKNIVFVGGGIGMAPLRTLLLYMLDNRDDYGKITLLYGAKSPDDMAFAYEIDEWRKAKNTEVVLTIDKEAEGWTEKVGLIPNVLLEMAPSTENAVAITCGPPIMIKFTLQALDKLGFKPEQIVTTLERRMKCGIGICGRCNIGDKYVCVDGPVFTYAELKEMVNEL
ncbi:Oxidoreductase FAD/NAD(P)-binding domain protein [uncultured delta proteobacterium]|uniref:Oxidoreductase FAD/NAD(P)-binding domain protein n=1 Tax=uncultured delta proteobacterium TaxID=34034 RepID=A0A212IUY6_9DELT|nr:Oxidoreductase FAD/NAD(P)-binding domain protein [uncultured delta proteobacterium]